MSNSLSLSMDMEPDELRVLAYHMLEAADQHSGREPINFNIKTDGDYDFRYQGVIEKGDDYIS